MTEIYFITAVSRWMKTVHFRHLRWTTRVYTAKEFLDRVDRLARQGYFATDDTGHIINGHVSVKVNQGESPVKAGGKLLVIDGGFSRAYQKQTGIAGYTLVDHSKGLRLAAHHPFESAQNAIEAELDIDSKREILEKKQTRLRVRDTDQGQAIQKRIIVLQLLLRAYRSGLIKEK
jgi:fructose-1,6-bisphosphatase-3